MDPAFPGALAKPGAGLPFGDWVPGGWSTGRKVEVYLISGGYVDTRLRGDSIVGPPDGSKPREVLVQSPPSS